MKLLKIERNSFFDIEGAVENKEKGIVMDIENKPKVFVIMPFSEDYLALYNELKMTFEAEFDFTNAGDLDNQQNIIKDIVEGIYRAEVIIADLTGLNPNVFYELGLAHAMNKKVIIIAQDIGELPFDIKSYRANAYSLQFNKLPALINELRKLLAGAVDGSVKYGNPVTDYIPDFYKMFSDGGKISNHVDSSEHGESIAEEEDGPKGFLDYIADIEENSESMTAEITLMASELKEMSASVAAATNDIDRVKSQSRSVDVAFVRNVCRKLSMPIDQFTGKLQNHVYTVNECWVVVENGYLSLLENQYSQTPENSESLKTSMTTLEELQTILYDTDEKIESFVDALRGNIGMERRLNKSITALVSELESYLSMTDAMASSIDRIISKSAVLGVK
jgi:hypothetical protein